MKHLSRRVARILMVFAVVLVAGTAGARPTQAVGAALGGDIDGGAWLQSRTKADVKLDSALASLATKSGPGLAAEAEKGGLVTKGDSVQVQITVDPAQVAAASAAVLGAGGEVTKASADKTTIQGFVPVSALMSLANDQAVQFIRRPVYFEPMGDLQVGQLDSEGVAVTNANAWHSAGQRGNNIKVAVIDVGFEGYADLLGSDLPANVVAQNFADTGTVSDGGPHGTACAEIVYDMAPGVSLLLLRIATNIDVEEAATFAISQGAHIISSSIGTNGQTAGDGNNSFTSLVTQANNAGVFWATAAGNQREQHWGGPNVDADGDKFLEVSPNNEINCLGATGGTCSVLPDGFTVGASLRWNNWSAPVNQDFDLILFRNDGSGWESIASSDDVQNGGAGQRPFEVVVATTAGGPAAYGFAVQAFSINRPANLDLFTIGGWRLEFPTYARSMTDQAASPNVITVAALDSTAPFPQERYSSEGPALGPGGDLTGGIVKPDIAAFANVNTRAYGTTPGRKFNGTSSATPHVAGAAALVRGANPSFTQSQIASFLTGRAIDMGAAGKDTLFGMGRLWLGQPGTNPPPPPPGARTRFDLNGDSRSDIVWRNNTTGANTLWMVDNGNVTSAGMTRVADQNWRIVGTGDFNGDRRADLLWRNMSTGANTTWLMNSASSTARSLPAVNDANWRVVGTGDFNGDGRSDILWRHATSGANTVWITNSTGGVASTSIGGVADQNWQIIGTGDFNGDSRADILWRNSSTGANTIWFMNGSAATRSSIRGVPDLSWRIAGTGDFNGDNRSDILWRNASTGANSMWFMNGTAISALSILRVDDPNWQVAHDGDFNGDRKADILWRNMSTGANTIWFMNGAVRQGSRGLTTVADMSWRVIGNSSAGTGASTGPFKAPAEGAELVASAPAAAPATVEPMAMAVTEENLGEMELGAPAAPLAVDGDTGESLAATTRIYLPILIRR